MEYMYNPLANWPQKKITILILKNALEMKKKTIFRQRKNLKKYLYAPQINQKQRYQSVACVLAPKNA